MKQVIAATVVPLVGSPVPGAARSPTTPGTTFTAMGAATEMAANLAAKLL